MNPVPWNIGREARRWTREESECRIYQAPRKIEFVAGIFSNERERLTVLAMILETMGIDKVVQLGKLEDWQAAVAERAKQETGP